MAARLVLKYPGYTDIAESISSGMLIFTNGTRISSRCLLKKASLLKRLILVLGISDVIKHCF